MINSESKKSVTPERPFLGFGLGLRTDYYQRIVDEQPPVDWFEIISENYMVDGGKPLEWLDRIRADYPMVMHGVSMSIGSTDPINFDYLRDLKKLIARVEPQWVSDHLCWTGVNAHNMHDLLPLPYTEEAVQHVSDRIARIQDFLGRQILVENLSSYVTFKESVMSECEFYTEIANRADCLMLLDINNIYVSACNHNFDPMDYIRGVPSQRVWQHHLAGHTYSRSGKIIIDTHDQPVRDEVWDLYCAAAKHFGPVSTMIERDDNMPEFDELLAELVHAREIAAPILKSRVA
ncbi:MAG: DUF692 domain-containing protein [Pseudomonadota bacterium]